MKKLHLCLLYVTMTFPLAAQNTFPASGNVGIGTASPAGELDVYNAYYTHGYKFIDNMMPNPSVGFLNPIAMALRQGKKLYPDEEFANGLNSIAIYDNGHSGNITITRTNTISDLPNSSGNGLQITHSGTGEAPGFGGFYQTIQSGMNKTIVQIFRAKLPLGYMFNIGSNSVGTGGSNYWLSNAAGTGKWEWYIRVVQCGNAGPFSSSGYIYVTGSPAPSSTAPLVWYLASCTAFDITSQNQYNGDYLTNQSALDQNASFRISGNGVIGGNMLIGKTSQTNPAYKLDVNGDVRANKVVVNTTGADYVFDSSYSMLAPDSLRAYIERHHHLPGIPSANQMRQSGMDVSQTETLLLEKVEILTRYVLDLEQRIEELEAQKRSNK